LNLNNIIWWYSQHSTLLSSPLSLINKLK